MQCQWKYPLHLAIKGGHLSCTKLLLRKGADYSSLKLLTGESPLHMACDPLSQSLVPHLVKLGADIDKQDYCLQTPLHLAATGGMDRLTAFLLKKGADFTTRDKDGNTPLLGAESYRVLRHLIEAGADAKGANYEGETLLHYIAKAPRQLNFLKLLIQEGAPVNIQSVYGRTPLHDAAISGNIAGVNFLLKKGACPDISDRFGATPLSQCTSFDELYPINRSLILHGANFHITDCEGRTPLHKAADHSAIKNAKLLIAKGAKLNVQDEEGFSPLHLALNRGHLGFAEYLCKQGADPHLLSNEGKTPIEVAKQATQNQDLRDKKPSLLAFIKRYSKDRVEKDQSR